MEAAELLVVASPLSQTTPPRPGFGREVRAIPSMKVLDRSEPEIRSPHAVTRKHPSAKPPKGKSPS
jgi:hypothetical protein